MSVGGSIVFGWIPVAADGAVLIRKHVVDGKCVKHTAVLPNGVTKLITRRCGETG